MSNHSGDGAPEAPPVITNRNETFKGYKPPDLGPQKTTYHKSKRQAIASSPAAQSYVQRMQWITGALLFYTASHNALNAWHRAGENPFWFLFIILGVISMEWFLHCGHQAWLKGEFTRRQTRIFKAWGTLFFFFIILGVLTGAQVADSVQSQFIDFHYHWVLPIGTVLLLPALWHLNGSNEITIAKNAGANLRMLSEAEREREGHEREYMDLMKRRDERIHVWNLRKALGDGIEKRIRGSWGDRYTRNQIEMRAKDEVPKLLQKAGITTETKPVKK